MGIGAFRLVDFDVVRPANFNRQIYALTSNLGKRKADIAAERILEINPDCSVEKYPVFLHHDSFDSVFSLPTDIVVDAIDSVNPKVVLLSECYKRKIPIISSMGAAGRKNPAFIKAGDLFNVVNCPLAQHVRKKLRKLDISSGIRCVYSTELPDKSLIADEEENDPGDFERGRKRKPIGSLSYITGIFGLMIVSEVIFHLLGGQNAQP